MFASFWAEIFLLQEAQGLKPEVAAVVDLAVACAISRGISYENGAGACASREGRKLGHRVLVGV